MSDTFLTRLQAIQKNIESAQKPNQKVTMIAVTKTQSTAAINESYDLGIRNFGENYAQEMISKIDELSELHDLQWHYIGNLQTNKMNKIVPKIHWFHSLSQMSQVEKLEKMRLQNISLPKLLVQINVAQEDSKLGLHEDQAEDFFKMISEHTGLSIIGLMTFPPYQDEAEKNRTYFARLTHWKEKINQWNLERIQIRELSMGVSNDYSVAIEEGATMVRVGEALFGSRK